MFRGISQSGRRIRTAILMSNFQKNFKMNNFFKTLIIALIFGTSLIACEPDKEALEEKTDVNSVEQFSPVIDRRKNIRPRP